MINICGLKKMDQKRKELTAADLLAAERLKAAADAAKANDKKLTQEEIASRVGMTQGAVGHYMNGRRALNLEALFAICGAIKVNPAHIYPELMSEKMLGNTDELSEFIRAYAALSQDRRLQFLEIMQAASS